MTVEGAAATAQYEISIAGKPCSYRDRKDIAVAAAEHLKRKFPHCEVVVKHLPNCGDHRRRTSSMAATPLRRSPLAGE